MARHHRGPDGDRRHLRHELQAHARAGVAIWLFWRDRHDPAGMRRLILAIPARRLAVRPHFLDANRYPPCLRRYRVSASQRSGRRVNIMTAISASRTIIPLLAFVACGAALAFAIQHVRREQPVDATAATTAPAISKPVSAPLARAQSEANAVVDALIGSPPSPGSGDGVPTF